MAKTSNKPDAPKKPFEKKDYVTITLSILALLTSVSGVYFNNFKVDNNLDAKIVEFRNDRFADDYEHDTVTVSLAYFNSGNRQAIVRRPLFQLEDSFEPTKFDNNYKQVANSDIFPFALEPKQIKLVDVKVPLNIIRERYNRRVNQSTTYNSRLESYLRFWYFGVDCEGKARDNFGSFDLRIITEKGSVAGIGQFERNGKVYDYGSTAIFKN